MSLISVALWRNRKLSRSEWRATHSQTKKRTRHGGRGRKYGIKGRKNPTQR